MSVYTSPDLQDHTVSAHDMPLHYLKVSRRRIQRLQSRLKAASSQLTRWRILCFVLTLLLSAAALEWLSGTASGAVATTGLVVFGFLVRKHQGIRQLQRQSDRAPALKDAHHARLSLCWEEIPEVPLTLKTPDHPYENDLDITGVHSLYRLLHTCLTREGGERLKHWLLHQKASQDTLRRRQKQVAALRPMIAWRDRLHLNLQEAASGDRQAHMAQDSWESAYTLHQLDAIADHHSARPLLFLSANAGVTALLYGLHQWTGLPGLYWQISLGLYAIIYWYHRHHIGGLFADSQALQFDLHRLAAIFSQMETFPVKKHAVLQAIFAAVQGKNAPTQLLRQLGRIVSAASLQGNPLLWGGMNLIMPWDLFFAWRFNQLKPRLRHQLPLCLEALWELEALCALAHYAWGHPAAVFPDFVADGFRGSALGHPLLAETTAANAPSENPKVKVRNDFTLSHTGEGFLITGSNMAGKSTFLKSLGLNIVLAQAGSVVDARQMAFAPVRLMTCIRVSDSVNDGFSYFYAEVRRLKAILEALKITDDWPVFYLVDEIFKGTNNRERLLGSQAYLKALVNTPALGGVSTHDLELVSLADEHPQWKNYHFREFIEAGKMVFDYRLREGPCPTTNALRIMALEGLPIPEDSLK